MKVRSKITAIMAPLIILAIVVINLTFAVFFENYLEEHENSQINSSKESLASYIAERDSKYLGSVNDWAHWDDTYQYINNDYPAYKDENMVPVDFLNLDISFSIFIQADGSIYDKNYYDFARNTVTDFPASFFEKWDNIYQYIKNDDQISGIFQLGKDFYFLSSTNITDSDLKYDSGGHLVFGRIIDQSIVSAMETTTGCNINSIDITDGPSDTDNNSAPILVSDIIKHDDASEVKLIIPNSYDTDSSVQFTLLQNRNLYLEGMNSITRFALINAFIMCIIFLIAFFLLGNYLSKPFKSLIKDVKNIDLKEKEIKKLPLTFNNNEFSYLRRTINEMLEEIETEQILVRDKDEKLYATLLSVGDGVISVDRDKNIQFMNPVAEKLTGWGEKDALNQPIDHVFRIINEYTRKTVESPVDMVFETEDIIELTNHTLLIAKDGSERAVEDTAAPIRNKYNEVVGCVLVFRDFSEKKEKQKRIEYLSYHDQLTGLYNRRFFEEEIKRLDTTRNLPISFIYVDINGLKTINDAFGHVIGDELIQEVSNVFLSSCRADDIISRTGGDEFVIILPKTGSENTEKMVKRLAEIIKTKRIMNIDVSVSFGWDTKTDPEQSAWVALKNAEDTMYQKKLYISASVRHAVISSIFNNLYLTRPEEKEHSQRVSLLCEATGKAFNLDAEQIQELKTAGELHDIGKIAIDKAILNKPDKLSPSELTHIRNHPETGFRILGTLSEYYNIATYVLAHHERWDGKGYPKGIKGDNIIWQARVIALADAYDAMTSKRPYKKMLTKEKAIAEIKKNAGKQFDPEIAQVFVEKVLHASW